MLFHNRKKEQVIIVDTNMHNFTLQLTNGIFIPSYRVHNDHEDTFLNSLREYLLEFVGVLDVKQKIKNDFGLD